MNRNKFFNYIIAVLYVLIFTCSCPVFRSYNLEKINDKFIYHNVSYLYDNNEYVKELLLQKNRGNYDRSYGIIDTETNVPSNNFNNVDFRVVLKFIYNSNFRPSLITQSFEIIKNVNMGDIDYNSCILYANKVDDYYVTDFVVSSGDIYYTFDCSPTGSFKEIDQYTTFRITVKELK